MPDCELCGEIVEHANLTDGTPVTVTPGSEFRLVPTVNRRGEIRLSPRPVRELHVCIPERNEA